MDLTVESGSPIFIVGCDRSGTTLLRDLLRSHPRLTFPRESHIFPAFYRATRLKAAAGGFPRPRSGGGSCTTAAGGSSSGWAYANSARRVPSLTRRPRLRLQRGGCVV